MLCGVFVKETLGKHGWVGWPPRFTCIWYMLIKPLHAKHSILLSGVGLVSLLLYLSTLSCLNLPWFQFQTQSPWSRALHNTDLSSGFAFTVCINSISEYNIEKLLLDPKRRAFIKDLWSGKYGADITKRPKKEEGYGSFRKIEQWPLNLLYVKGIRPIDISKSSGDIRVEYSYVRRQISVTRMIPCLYPAVGGSCTYFGGVCRVPCSLGPCTYFVECVEYPAVGGPCTYFWGSV